MSHPDQATMLNDRYQLGDELGRGGMGTVYRARDTLLEREVAVKWLRSPAPDGGPGASVLREAQVIAKLNHPNIVQVHDAGELDGSPFIVMELVEGESLHLRRPEDLSEILSISIQVCAALEHAHAHGIVHRDLKPENVLIASDGTAKLTDLGLARSAASRVSSEGSLVGTVFYLAPELAQGQPIDGRADLYALGVILYELTTGRLPFESSNPLRVIAQHLNEPVVPPSAIRAGLPAGLEAIILKLLAKSPAERFQSAGEAGAALAEVAALLRSQQARHSNLPLQLSSFVGRERELAQLKAQLETARLVTLTGAGGCGKTRLALRGASELVPQFPDGVWLVELGGLSDAALVGQSVASVLGLGEVSERPTLDLLTDFLRSKTMLLLLDNCEHLISSCAQLAETLLQASPKLRILATSREALGIAGERVLAVQPLAVPEPGFAPPTGVDLPEALLQFEGVRLFSERAAGADPEFRLTEANSRPVVQICYRLDGIPLAIELAAARVKALSVDQIAARLDDRFRLLTGGSRTALPRHQTLQALIDWSHDLLSEPERVLLRRLSVFAGGWTLEASEAVCAGDGLEVAEVLDLLSRLVERSLVLVDQRETAPRYRMLDTIRQYARSKVLEAGEAEPARIQHLGYYLKLAEAAEPGLRGPEQLAWLSRLEAEYDNLRAALDWAEGSGDSESGLRLAGALFRFWLLRGHADEGRHWLEGTLARAESIRPSRAFAVALRGAAYLAIGHGQLAAGWDRAERSLAISRDLGDPEGVADSLLGLGRAAYFQGEYAEARSRFQESLAVSREANYPWGAGHALYRLGMVNLIQGDYTQARPAFEESVAIFRELGDKWSLSYSLSALGEEAFRRGEYELARRVLEESLSVLRQLGSKLGIAMALSELGWLGLSEGDYLTARVRLEESLALRQEMGYQVGVAIALNLLGDVALRQGDYPQAKALIEKGLRLREEMGNKSGIAWSLQNLGYLAQRQGEPRQAAALLEESLSLFRELGNKMGIAECLEGLAGVAAGDQAPGESAAGAVRAVRLLAAADSIRALANTPLPPYRRPDVERDLAAARAQLSDPGFAAAWEAGRGMSGEQAVAYALGEASG